MLRHTVLFLHRDTATSEQRRAMLRGLAFVRAECAGLVAADYGDDLLGGSSPLLEVPPWERTPRWRKRPEGPPNNYDVAMHVDFEDEIGLIEYESDPVHLSAARFNASVSVPDLTARVDWWYDGPPRIHRGHVRHTAMFVWCAAAGADERGGALASARALVDAEGVLSLAVGEGLGQHPADFDWILDVELSNVETARAFVNGAAYADAIASIAAVTKHEWTARVTHLMRGT